MRIFFTIDTQKRVHPVCDYQPDITPDSDWFVGEIDGNAYEEHGIPLWKFESGICSQRTAIEIQNDMESLPVSEPSEQEILRADVDYLLMITEEM